MAIINGTSGNNTIRPSTISPGVTGGPVTDAGDSIVGGGGNDTMQGGAGNDTLVGSLGSDFFFASTGSDSVIGGGGTTGSDFLDYGSIPVAVFGPFPGPISVAYNASGYSGNVLKYNSSGQSIYGTDTFTGIRGINATAGADTLVGSTDTTPNLPFAVVLRGMGGNDFIDGAKSQLNHANYALATSGVVVKLQTMTDELGNWFGTAQDGQGGTDTLKNVERAFGSSFNDTITGSTANDRFDASVGSDVYDGHGGFDAVDYGTIAGPVVITSGAPLAGLYGFGTATVVKGVGGVSGTDTLTGFNEIRGTSGNDSISGVDTTYTWNGMRLRGGAGNDTIQGFKSTANTVDYQGATGAVTIDLQTSGPDALGNWVGSAIGNSSVGTDMLLSVNQVRATNFNDTISGTSGNDVFSTFLAGSHTFFGRGGLNDVRAAFTTASDIVIDLGTTASGTGFGGYLGSIIKAGGQVDMLYDFNRAQGGGGNDSIYGTPGNDTLSGGLGNNLMDGRAGSNWVTYRNFTGQNVPTHGVTIDLTEGTAHNYADGTDTLVNIQNAIGSQFADEIVGMGDWVDFSYIRGDGGNDILRALDPGTMVTADYLSSLSGITASLRTGVVSDDGWFGGVDHLINIQSIRGSNFADSIFGSNHISNGDTLDGAGGDDSLNGGAGNDLLLGGTGNDSMIGGIGNDSMSGGTGNDTYVVDAIGDVVDEIAGEGTDTVLANISYTLAANVENLTLTTAAKVATGNGAANVLTGSAGVDTLLGLDGNDTLVGNAGADSLDGGAADDLLQGGDGNDKLSGGTGNDTLVGGVGADLLTGGAGNDVFSFLTAAESGDTIADFVSGQDAVQFAIAGFGGGLALGQNLVTTHHFISNTTGKSNFATGQFVYQTNVGKLWWDADGSGVGVHVLVATLTGSPALAATDIWLA